MTQSKSKPSARVCGFTLVELLVVVVIIGVLVAVIVPAVARAKESARTAACAGNLRQIGIALRGYATEYDGQIPYGPKAPPMMTATQFYPSTGAPTSLISLSNGSPVGLGLLLRGHLAAQPKVLFCPSSDQPSNAEGELAKVGYQQAQCSYYYRHGSVARQFDTPASATQPVEHILLAQLGNNRLGQPIRALVMDTQFPAPPGFAEFGIAPRTHHQEQWCNTLFSDDQVQTLANTNQRFTVNLNDYAALTNAFDRILRVLENADTQ